MTTRRAILQTGGAAVVIIGAGAGGWALTRAPEKAREPWSMAGKSFGDWRLDALAYAILAPNPHNMQPWRIRLDGDDALTIYADLARMLPETDPPNRQITIGFGCFLELLRQAAAERGGALTIEPFPEGAPEKALDERPIAHIRAAPGAAEADPLFAAVLDRRTNRAPFKAQPVQQAALDQILIAGGTDVIVSSVNSGDRIDTLKALAREAWETEWKLDRTRRESIDVTRIGKREIDETPWGLALAGPVMDALGAGGVLTRENMDIPEKAAYEQSIEFYNKAIDSAAAFVWMSTATNTRLDQISAGAAWIRMQQAATLQGVAFHPLSQALQEFPEMAGPYARAHEMLAHQPGATVQMLARIGYADAPPPAPREAMMSKLIRA